MAAKRIKVSGKHRSPRLILSASDEQIAAWQAAAVRAGVSWAEWARAALDSAARR